MRSLAVAMLHSALRVTCIRGIKVGGILRTNMSAEYPNSKVPLEMGEPTIELEPHVGRASVSQWTPPV